MYYLKVFKKTTHNFTLPQYVRIRMYIWVLTTTVDTLIDWCIEFHLLQLDTIEQDLYFDERLLSSEDLLSDPWCIDGIRLFSLIIMTCIDGLDIVTMLQPNYGFPRLFRVRCSQSSCIDHLETQFVTTVADVVHSPLFKNKKTLYRHCSYIFSTTMNFVTNRFYHVS